MKQIHLQYLSKQRGGRIESLETFKVVCGAEEAHATLQATHSLKSPEESDIFTHVLHAVHAGESLVVKVQEMGRMVAMELMIHERLQNHPNMIRYVCDFDCKFNPVVWSLPLRTPRPLCDREGEDYHVIVMEHIAHDLADVFEKGTLPDTIFISVVQQVGLALLEFHTRHGISHNDINRGNVLLDIVKDKDTHIVYTIADMAEPIKIATYGHTVVFIDFQRGSFVEDSADVLTLAFDEISLAYELMSKWSKPIPARMAYLQDCMFRTMRATSLEDMLDILLHTPSAF